MDLHDQLDAININAVDPWQAARWDFLDALAEGTIDKDAIVAMLEASSLVAHEMEKLCEILRTLNIPFMPISTK